jgi:hypothetical protein
MPPCSVIVAEVWSPPTVAAAPSLSPHLTHAHPCMCALMVHRPVVRWYCMYPAALWRGMFILCSLHRSSLVRQVGFPSPCAQVNRVDKPRQGVAIGRSRQAGSVQWMLVDQDPDAAWPQAASGAGSGRVGPGWLCPAQSPWASAMPGVHLAATSRWHSCSACSMVRDACCQANTLSLNLFVQLQS